MQMPYHIIGIAVGIGTARLIRFRESRSAAACRGRAAIRLAFGALLALVALLGVPVRALAQPEELKLVAEFRGHTADIWRLCFSGDGKTLVTSSHDGTARFWTIPELKEPLPVIVESAKDDKTIIHGSLPRHGPFVAFLPDGKTLLVADTLRAVSSRNDARSRLRLLDVATRKEINPPKEPLEAKVGFFLDLSPDGKTLLAVGSRDLGVRETGQTRLELWDRKTGKMLGHLSGRLPHYGSGHAFSPDSKRVAIVPTHAKEVSVWDVKSRTSNVTITPSAVSFGNQVFAGMPDGVAFAPDGNRVAVACRDTRSVQFFDAESGDPTNRIRFGRDRGPQVLTYSSDGRYLAVAGSSTTMWIWDLKGATGAAMAKVMRPTILVFSPSGKHLAVVCEDGSFSVRLWALPDSK